MFDQMSAREILIATERSLGIKSFYEFVRMAWPHVPGESRYEDTRLHEVLCNVLQQFTEGTLRNEHGVEVRNILINVPPGLGKSIIVGVLYPAWDWIQNEKKHNDYLCVSFDLELMWRDSGRCAELIDSAWFQARWGDRLSRRQSKAGTDRIGNWSTNKFGMRVSASIGGKVTGKHPDRVIIDDPTKPIDATDIELKRSRAFWSGTLASRAKDKREVKRICIMQRIAEDDLSGLLEDIGWYVVRIPFVYDQSVATHHDWRTVEGECIDPVRYPPEIVEEIKRDAEADGGDVWDTQWQQKPASREGNIFKVDWFQLYDPSALPPPEQIDAACISFDLNFKGDRQSKKSDYVSGQAWCRVKQNYYLLWRVYGRFSFVQTLDVFRSLCERYPWILAKLVEDKANGPALEDTLCEEIPGIELVDPGGVSKVARAYSVTPLMRGMRVFFPYNMPELNAFQNNLKRFPKLKNDDDIDAMSQGLRYLSVGMRWEDRYSGMGEALKGMQ